MCLGVAADHPLAHVLEIAAVHTAGLHHIIKCLLVNAGFGAGGVGLRPHGRVGHGYEIIDQLDFVTIAQRADMNDVFSPCFDHRANLLQGFRIRPDKRIEPALFCFLGGAPKRSINQLYADCLQFCRQCQC